MKQLIILVIVILLAIGAYSYFAMRVVPNSQVTPTATSTTVTSVATDTQNNTMPPSGDQPSKNYQNDKYGFSFEYPVGSSEPTSTFPTSYLATGDWSLTSAFDHSKGTPVISVTLENSNEMKAGQFRVGVSNDPVAITDCLASPQNSGSGTSSLVTIQGKQFTLFNMQDGAMSHQLQAEVYRIVHNGMCYSLEAIVTGTNPDVYDPPRTVPFNTTMAFDALHKIVQSFTFAG